VSQFTDLPNGGIVRWSTFALVVAESTRLGRFVPVRSKGVTRER
jgi:hypothetical protein